jgi:hypothetical protein
MTELSTRPDPAMSDQTAAPSPNGTSSSTSFASRRAGVKDAAVTLVAAGGTYVAGMPF